MTGAHWRALALPATNRIKPREKPVSGLLPALLGIVTGAPIGWVLGFALIS